MPTLHPENRHTIRLNHALSFARANVYKNIHLDQLADAACLSKYHFSRVFRDQVGESPIRYLKRTRLERAACLLSNHRRLSIVEIASTCGYSSIQLFSRTFGDHFGYSPSEFRSNHVFSMEHSRGHENSEILYKKFSTVGINRDSPSTYPQINIVRLPITRVAYVRSFGYNSGSGKGAFNFIRDWSKINRLWTEDTEIIEVSWDYSSITPEEMCSFETCIAIPANGLPRPGISIQTISGGHYAVIQVPYKPGKNLRLFWKWFFLTLYTSPIFQKYAANISSGPWLCVYKPKMKEGKYVVKFFVYLCS